MKTYFAGIMFACIVLTAFSARNVFALDNANVEKKTTNTDTTAASASEKYSSQVLITGKWGSAPGEFGLGEAMGEEGDDIIPTEIVSDDKGNIYVLDNWNNRVQKFDANGKFLEAYPLETFVRPTNDEFEQSIKAWNKRMNGFIKIKTNKLAWMDGQLYVHQKRMPDVKANKFEDSVLVLKSGKFIKAPDKAGKDHEKINQWRKTDKRGNSYSVNNEAWEKHNKNGDKVFEFPIWHEHKYGTRTLRFRSVTFFDENVDCFLELRPYSLDSADWSRIYLSDGGGMQVIKWCKK